MEKPGLDHTQLAMLAHELRGALTVVAGLADLLEHKRLAPDDREKAFRGISRAVDRADALLESALQERRSLIGRKVAFDLAELVDGIVTEQRSISGRRIDFSAIESPLVKGDALALGRAIANLIDNALKYSLGSQAVEVSVTVRDGRAIVTVSDRGPGIPEDQVARALEPFERLGREAQSTVAGSGLGLAVVSQIMAEHKGTVSFLPREGGGTMARLELPLA